MAVFSASASSSETSLTLYQRGLIELNIAVHPLQRQAVEILVRDQRPLSELDEEAFAGIWETRRIAEEHLVGAGNTNRLCYAPLSADKSPTWQIAPYASLPTWLDNCVFRKIYSIWKQAVVLFRTFFPAAQPSRDELERVRTYWSDLQTDREIPVREKHGHGSLTEDGVIRKQLVYPASKDEGKVLLLYNYAPLRTGGEQLHFLLIPNPASPAENFLELEQEQYVQVLALAQKVALWAKQEFGEHATVHFFDKTGKIAGQTQPLYHAHLIIVADRRQEIWGRIALFFRMLVPSRPLPQSELENRVFDYQDRLGSQISSNF